MCGITGFVRPGGEADAGLLRSMTDTMIARGPDHGSSMVFPGGAGLGHRRLAVLDLTAAADQPLANEDRTVWVVFNGEIYNYPDLRIELAALGHRLAGTGDTEVLPHAYEEWGDRFPERLRGMFALALWDVRRRRLLLARDRLGIKPLSYLQRGAELVFGSTLEPLAADPSIPRRVELSTLSRFLAMGSVAAPESILAGVRKLLPGHLLVFEEGRAAVRPYWRPPSAPGPAMDEGEALDALQERLEESVRLHLASDVPLGAFLSGGIDSSLVAAAMTRATSRVRTFTIGFREAGFDEVPHARRVAAHLGTEHTERYLTGADALALVPTLPAVYDEPFADSSALPTMLLAAMARQSVTVALSGDGGDELFAGYPRYRWFLAARRLLALPLALRRLARPLASVAGGRLANAAQLLDAADPLELYAGMVGTARFRTVAELVGQPPSLAGTPLALSLAAGDRDWLQRLSAADLASYLPDDILVKVDRATMASSLEARVPLLDHRFVELARSIPMDLHFRRGEGKCLAGRLLARYLPPVLTGRPKQGFAVPLAAWLRGELGGLLAEATEPGRLTREGFFRPAAVGRLVAEHRSGRLNHHHVLWAVLAFQLWRERWKAEPAG